MQRNGESAKRLVESFDDIRRIHGAGSRRLISEVQVIGFLADKGCLCIADLVEDDGRFHMNEPGFKGHNGFKPETLAGLFESLGLESISFHIFYNGSKTVNETEIDYSLFMIVGTKP